MSSFMIVTYLSTLGQLYIGEACWAFLFGVVIGTTLSILSSSLVVFTVKHRTLRSGYLQSSRMG